MAVGQGIEQVNAGREADEADEAVRVGVELGGAVDVPHGVKPLLRMADRVMKAMESVLQSDRKCGSFVQLHSAMTERLQQLSC